MLPLTNGNKEDWEDRMDGDGLGGKQPNFLQKLYDFLALDPHPCPDVIYWASDSRQLVIAQPDRLVKEVLPKLYKHDKLSSFGRQLNIYGFSRLFPGRQFKDAKGNVSDASVWSHTTLHRSSSSSDILSVKRRAAPKLFRTRRLPNGQLVRARAGPAVEAKFREVRETIAESRRQRGSGSGSSLFTNSPEGLISSFGSASASGGKVRLPDITEGVETDDVMPVYDFLPRQDTILQAHQGTRRDSDTSMVSFWGENIETNVEGQAYQPLLQVSPDEPIQLLEGFQPLQTETRPLLPVQTRPFQSCPASLHSTPVPTRLRLAHSNVGLQTWDEFMEERNVPAAIDYTLYPTPVTSNRQEITVATTIQAPVHKIAAPAAINPFIDHLQSANTDAPPHVFGNSFSPSSWNHGSIHPNHIDDSPFTPLWTHRGSWESDTSNSPQLPDGHGGTIDPRWISPLSSLFPTPIGTPRVGSPVTPQMPDMSFNHILPDTQMQMQMQMPNTIPAFGLMGISTPDVVVGQGPTMSRTNTLATQSYPPRQAERPRAVYNPGSYGSTSGSGTTGSDGLVHSGNLSTLGY